MRLLDGEARRGENRGIQRPLVALANAAVAGWAAACGLDLLGGVPHTAALLCAALAFSLAFASHMALH